jgi:signal peptidase I
MPINELIAIYLIGLLIVMLPSVGLYGMFKKAGVEGWKAFVPFYNTWEMIRLGDLKKYWFFLQFVPIVGWFMSIAILIEFVKTFGKFKFYEHVLTVLAAALFFIYVGFNKTDKFLGADALQNHKKSAWREWVDAAIFAIVAAGLIRMFIFEAYVIPTPSMEKTLLVNDFLFVSKTAYGSRVPNTPLAFPLVHHTLPVVKTKSYLEWINLKYRRWFASPVKRNDVVVFNLPVGDTVINNEHLVEVDENGDPLRGQDRVYGSQRSYYDAIRDFGGSRQMVWDKFGDQIIVRPVDKRENFIKRCVAIAGDTLLIKDGVVYINGKINDIPPQSETFYIAILKTPSSLNDVVTGKYNLTEKDIVERNRNQVVLQLTHEQFGQISKDTSFIQSITPINDGIENVNMGTFPNDTVNCKWTIDNFGPLYIPKKGATIQLTAQNYSRYERVIRTYEHNEFEMKDGKFYLNGKETDRYTFQMDYFWLMGDNRHNSLDARYWGFVPEDHVVGKASLIFFSWDKGPRWNRIFKKIK